MFIPILSGLLANSSAIIQSLVVSYGYLAIFVLMVLESASLPIPSEVLLPLGGYLAAKGSLSFWPTFAVVMLGAFVGNAIAYAIGYYLGKDVIYKHLQLFRIKKKSLDQFDAWFDSNGFAAVFLSRLIPEVRALMSFPAGFAEMPLKEFFFYSMIGAAIWNLVLMLFGFYLLSADSAVIVMASIGVFAIALYVIYKIAMRRMKKK
jgi:membrane protein DedA with SNARE-associated domain